MKLDAPSRGGCLVITCFPYDKQSTYHNHKPQVKMDKHK